MFREYTVGKVKSACSTAAKFENRKKLNSILQLHWQSIFSNGAQSNSCALLKNSMDLIKCSELVWEMEANNLAQCVLRSHLLQSLSLSLFFFPLLPKLRMFFGKCSIKMLCRSLTWLWLLCWECSRARLDQGVCKRMPWWQSAPLWKVSISVQGLWTLQEKLGVMQYFNVVVTAVES